LTFIAWQTPGFFIAMTKARIVEILGLEESDPLVEKVEEAIAVFDRLPTHLSYQIGFSGGKDSHAVVGCYRLWTQLRNQHLDLIVAFSDTQLEIPDLYQTIDKISCYLESLEIEFSRLYPTDSKAYWWTQFVKGYPVPDYRNRWCTNQLKILPMKASKRILITGRHYGESQSRDARLKDKYCGTNECGVDLITEKSVIEPILNWRNCHVWDFLFYADKSILYEGIFNELQSTYAGTTDKSGSLRMGCFMCPVISRNTLKNKASEFDLAIRDSLEHLRSARRINSEKTGKKGAIYIGDRRTVWNSLDTTGLQKRGYTTQKEIEAISEAIQDDYCYPPTYKREWIESEHHRLLKRG